MSHSLVNLGEPVVRHQHLLIAAAADSCLFTTRTVFDGQGRHGAYYCESRYPPQHYPWFRLCMVFRLK